MKEFKKLITKCLAHTLGRYSLNENVMETFFKRLTGTLLLLTMFVGHFSATAQDATEGVPLVREGVKWIYNYHDFSIYPGNWTFFTVEFHGTTEIEGKTYSNCYYYLGDEANYSETSLMGWAREDAGKVYARYNPNCTFDDYFYTVLKPTLFTLDDEVLIYDFNDMVNCLNNTYISFNTQDSADYFTEYTTEIGGITRRVYEKTESPETYGYSYIEGVGVDDYSLLGSRNLLVPHVKGMTYGHRKNKCCGLSHVIGSDGEIEYKGHLYLYYQTAQENQDNNTPDPNAPYVYVPLVRQGVKFVYNCNHSDGENWFYTMTFKGSTTINGVDYANLYWYDGYTMDRNAVPCAWMREVDKRVYIIYNDAFDRDDPLVRTEPVLQIPGEYENEFALYDFNDMGALWSQATLGGNSYSAFSNYKVRQEYVGTDTKRNLHYNTMLGVYLLEGVGPNGLGMAFNNIAYPFTIYRENSYYHNSARLSHVIDENGNIEYKSDFFKSQFTGIDGVKDCEPTPQLRTGCGGIDIDGDYRGPVDVIDLSGRVVARQTIDGTAHIAVEPGIYVVRLAGHSHKIVVR